MDLLCFLALVACRVAAAPATSSQPSIAFNLTPKSTDTGPSLQLTQYSGPSSNIPVIPLQPASTSLLYLANLTSSQLSQSGGSSTVPVVSLPSPIVSSFSSSSTAPPNSTFFVTEVATAFVTTTANAAPSLPTIVTVFVTATATTTTTPPPSWENRTLWAAPSQMTDLSAFNVTYFPSGQRNLHIVARVPSHVVAPTAKFIQEPLSSPLNATSPSTILQLVYPAQSVNPGSKPEGGADFYASPLNLAGARNVTLEYSVFFPFNFNWVKGGKLPGLFGGHTGCSGGTSARDCFSTRLMWRPQGVGELYLYAPKDKQTHSLCADIASVCDAAYGFSIGRGAFNFTAGDWTHLRQNVVLNTPGQNDGAFVLFVDGRQVINRTDMFYRDAVRRAKNNSTAGFLGLFFSTFFGGHGKAYATPKQQFTWFKDFAITRNE